MAYFIHQNRGQFIGIEISDGILYPPELEGTSLALRLAMAYFIHQNRGKTSLASRLAMALRLADGILYPPDRGQVIGIEISDGILYPPE